MPTTTPFNNLITFSRGSHAIVTGPNGLIQWAPNNLITHSEQLNTAAWSGGPGVFITPNNGVAPDGTTTADSIFESGTHSPANRWRGQDTASAIPAGNVTFSAYLKANGRNFAYLGVSTTGYSGGVQTGIDFSTGLAFNTSAYGTGVTLVGTTITPLPNGWYRLTLTATFSSSVVVRSQINISATADTSITYAGDITKGVFAWGAQLELGSTATTYNPTTVKNLLGFSEAFDNAAWTKSGSSIVTGAQANPVNGLFNAQKLMEDTSTGQHRVFNTTGVTYAASTPVCFSAYVKAAERSFVYFRLNNSGADFVTGFVNLTTGAVTTVTGAGSITATSIGSGWWRIAAIGTSAAATPVSGYIATATSGSVVSYTGDGNSGVYIYGAQLSDSASLDPYVPTPGAAPSSTAFYGPRFDFDPVTLLPRGLLVEEQRTNLILQSNSITAAAGWSNLSSGLAVAVANATQAPDGSTTATQLTFGGTNTFWGSGVTSVAGTTYTASIWIKTADGGADFSISLTHYPTGGGTTVDINVNVTSTWTRVTAVFPTVTVGTGASYLVIRSSSTRAVHVWGAQFEAGAFVTSYIPTGASTVTRLADVATIGGQNFAQWFGSTTGTFVVEVGRFSSVNSAATAGFISATDNPLTNDWILLFGDGVGTVGNYYSNGVNQATLNTGAGITSGGKTSFAYAANDFAFSVNGATVLTDTTGTLTTDITTLRIGAFASNPNFLNGHIRNISFIPVRAADFQTQALSRNTPWNVTLADGTNYNIPTYTARTADGTSYNVPRTVLTAARTQYSPV